MKRILIFILALLLMPQFQGYLMAKKPVKVETEKAAPTKSDTDDDAGDDSADKPEKKEVPKTEKKPKNGKPVDELARVRNIEDTLSYGLNEDRKDALEKILTIKDPIYRLRLGNKVADIIKFDRNPEILEKAITIAGEIGAKSTLPMIGEKLDDQSRDVRIAAVYAIKKLGGAEMKEKLIQKLKDQDLSKDDIFNEALLRTLSDFKATEILSIATAAIENPKTTKINREQLVLCIGTLGSKESKDLLLKLYKNDEEDQTLRSYAVSSLAKIGAAEAVSDIKNISTAIESYPQKRKEKYHTLYIYSLAALAKLGDPEVVLKIMDATRNNNAMERYKAIRMLQELKDKRTIDILKYRYKNDPSPKVRNAARDALKELGIDAEGGEIKETKKEPRDSTQEQKENKKAPGNIKLKSETPEKNKN